MNPQTKRLIVLVTVCAILLLALVAVKPLIYGGVKPYTLSKAGPLVGRIAQSMSLPNSDALPVPGRDFELTNTTYFENKTWVVTTIKQLNGSSEGGMVVLKQVDGVYAIMLGPGTAFSSVDLKELPSDVVLYIKAHGVVYDPVI